MITNFFILFTLFIIILLVSLVVITLISQKPSQPEEPTNLVHFKGPKENDNQIMQLPAITTPRIDFNKTKIGKPAEIITPSENENKFVEMPTISTYRINLDQKEPEERSYSPNVYCPHGIPKVRLCGICDEKKYKEMEGID